MIKQASNEPFYNSCCSFVVETVCNVSFVVRSVCSLISLLSAMFSQPKDITETTNTKHGNEKTEQTELSFKVWLKLEKKKSK